MTMSVTNTVEDVRPLRGLMLLWVGIAVYALMLLSGNRLLNDPDTMWQITVGQWILDHHAVPESDIYSFTMYGQPWISTQWLAQVLLAKTFALFRWGGPVALASGAIALTFALLAEPLARQVEGAASSLSYTFAPPRGALAGCRSRWSPEHLLTARCIALRRICMARRSRLSPS